MNYQSLVLKHTDFPTLAVVELGKYPDIDSLRRALSEHNVPIGDSGEALIRNLVLRNESRTVEVVGLTFKDLSIARRVTSRYNRAIVYETAAKYGFVPCSASEGLEICAHLAMTLDPEQYDGDEFNVAMEPVKYEFEGDEYNDVLYATVGNPVPTRWLSASTEEPFDYVRWIFIRPT